MTVRIYHNPRCSKSRATLALLESRGIEIEIVDYLREPPTRAELAALARKLGSDAPAMVRRDEPEYRAAAADREPTRDELLDLLAAEPKLLQRPIVEVGKTARIGRPPERVLDILDARE